MHKNNTPQNEGKICTLGRLHHPIQTKPTRFQIQTHPCTWMRQNGVGTIQLSHMALCQVYCMLQYLVGIGVKFGTSFKANCTSQIYIYIYRERERLHYWWLFHQLVGQCEDLPRLNPIILDTYVHKNCESRATWLMNHG